MSWLTIIIEVIKGILGVRSSGPSAEERAGRDAERVKQQEAEIIQLREAVKAASKPDMTIAEFEAKANRGEL